MIPTPHVVRVGVRDVGVYEYGDPAGYAVMTFHGIPASGAGFAWADGPASARGLRVIAPDRPGVGLSSPVKRWRVADYPSMVAALADELGVGRFAVWGYSGGGPYAVATAAALPDRVSALAVCAGMGEVGGWATENDFESTDRQMMKLTRFSPPLARLVIGTVGRLARRSPSSAYKSLVKQLSGSDADVLDRLGPPEEAMALFTQAFTRGARGVVDDYRATGGPWGVDFATVTAPTRIFQGTADNMVPPRHAEELAKRLPKAELIEWEGAGHMGTILHVEELLDWIDKAKR